MNWYIYVLKNYANFNGRARRKEYWMFTLFHMIIAILLLSLDYVTGLYGSLYGLYMLGMIVPSIAVAVRRMHDIGKSGWMVLVSFIPIIGSIWLLILLVTDSFPGENEYGPNPKENLAMNFS